MGEEAGDLGDEFWTMLEREGQYRSDFALGLLKDYILEPSKAGLQVTLAEALRDPKRTREENAVDVIAGLLQVGSYLIALRTVENPDKPVAVDTIEYVRRVFGSKD